MVSLSHFLMCIKKREIKMKVNILAGTRFQSGLVVNILSKLKHEVSVYSSSPKSKWNFTYPQQVSLYFVPLVSAIFSHITRVKSKILFKEISAVVFDVFISFFMKKSDVLHAWSSFGLYSIRKAKKNGSIIFIEKSCPHPYYQDKLLKEESETLGVDFEVHSPWFLDRIIKEFELADKIVVCSNYTLNSFLEQGYPKDKLYNVKVRPNFRTAT
jgi:hypothetical protein